MRKVRCAALPPVNKGQSCVLSEQHLKIAYCYWVVLQPWMIKQGQLTAQVIYNAMPLFRGELFKQSKTGNQMRLIIMVNQKLVVLSGAHDSGEVGTCERITAGIFHGSPMRSKILFPAMGNAGS